jgi:aspartate aminotransferase
VAAIMFEVAKQSVSRRATAADEGFARVGEFYFSSRYGKRRGAADICDFTFGNPHEMPLSGLVDALTHAAVPQDKNWFAYKSSEPEPQAFLAQRHGSELGLLFEPDDFALTPGAFAAISLALRILLDAGDAAIFSEPAWFCYEPMLRMADAVPIKVPLRAGNFELDVSAIEAAITPNTRLVIVNTPHNPTGRIYDRSTLEQLSEALERQSARIGRRIFLLSDEPYRRLRFDNRPFVSPAAIYPWTLIDYSYGKVLLAPGQRLGYLAVSPLMPKADREALRSVMFSAQMALGWCFPNALMQHAIRELEALSIDQAALGRRRDMLMHALYGAGYDMVQPEGTFYLWGTWPGDPERLWNALADREVFVMPGTILGDPDCFRISLTASDEMVRRALPVFGEVLQTI